MRFSPEQDALRLARAESLHPVEASHIYTGDFISWPNPCAANGNCFVGLGKNSMVMSGSYPATARQSGFEMRFSTPRLPALER
jgi:hypothetical protein